MKKTTLIFTLIYTLILCSCKESQQNTEITEATQTTIQVTTVAATASETIATDTSTEVYIENEKETANKDIFQNCIDDLYQRTGCETNIIDTKTFDLDNDGQEELFILCEGALLYNSGQLYVYKINGDSYTYCGSICAIQSELNNDIFNRNTEFASYNEIDLKSFTCPDKSICTVLAYSIRTFSEQYNFISKLEFDSNGVITEVPILMWGIDVKYCANGEEYVPYIYYYDNGFETKFTEEELNEYLNNIN